MPIVQEMLRRNSLDFTNQRRVVLLRDKDRLSWEDIAERVVNLENDHPCWATCRAVYNSFNAKKGRRVYHYGNCGRRKEKVTPDVEKYLEQRMLALRHTMVCTSPVLQRDLAKTKGVKLEASTVRKVLKKLGYKWLPRRGKRVYSPAVMLSRLAFAEDVLSLTDSQLRRKLSFCMDGCVLGVPPADTTQRENFCKTGMTHVWRKPSEVCAPKLAGDDEYRTQLPMARSIPLWGGVSADGFAEVAIHHRKKFDTEEWTEDVVDSGRLAAALAAVNPAKPNGPWTVLCDNESFLRTAASQKAHRRAKVSLWAIPPRSPDLNPVEKFWSWLRKELLKRDLADVARRRPALSKVEYVARVRQVCRTQRAKRVAGNCARGLKKVCLEVKRRQGAATSG